MNIPVEHLWTDDTKKALWHGRKDAYLTAAKVARGQGAIKMPWESVEQFANKLADHFKGLAELWGEK